MLDQFPVLDGSIMINLILFNPQISCSTPRLRQENRRAQLSDQRNEFLEWSELWRVIMQYLQVGFLMTYLSSNAGPPGCMGG